MKRVICIVALVLCALTVAGAQDKPKAETVRLEAQTQQELAEAQRVATEARAALEAASARYDAAQQKVVSTIYKAMADVGLKPKEWAIKQDQGGIYFEKLGTPAATTTASAPKPPGQELPKAP